MDDFGPAKNLMTMCFTYYHIGKRLVLMGAFLILAEGAGDLK